MAKSFQVFLTEDIDPDDIEQFLRKQIKEISFSPKESLANAAGAAKLGRISKLAKSAKIETDDQLAESLRALPEVVDVLSEDIDDIYPKPVRKEEAPRPPSPKLGKG